MTSQPPRRSLGFLIGYGLANTGAFLCFVPLLALLLPLKAQAIDPARGALVLSQVAIVGGIVAAGANLLFGAWSDATGRRRPWLLGGLAATLAALALIAAAPTPVLLAAALILFQLALNALFAPLGAILPDMVPDAQKGTAAAWAGLALPAANFFTAGVVGWLLAALELRFLVTGIAAAALLLPFALTLREAPRPRSPLRLERLSLVALGDHDFRTTLGARFLVETATTLNMFYLLFWLQQESGLPGRAGEGALALLIAAGTAAGLVAGFVGGILADRLPRRRLLVGGAALMMAAGSALTLAVPDWPGPLVGQTLFGAGRGRFATTTIMLVALVLPDPAHAGRDLGAMNIGMALSQSAGPALGALLLTGGAGLTGIYALAVLAALGGAVLVMSLQKIR